MARAAVSMSGKAARAARTELGERGPGWMKGVALCTDVVLGGGGLDMEGSVSAFQTRN